MSTYYCLYCKKCKKSIPIIRNAMYFDDELAPPDKLSEFISEHYSHGIVLLIEHEVDDLRYK